MSVYQNLMGQIENAGLLFNVKQAPVFAQPEFKYGDLRPIPVEGKKALINSKTGNVISIVSDRYKVVTNQEIFHSFCKSIEDSGVDAEGAPVNVLQTETGGRAMVDFVFPAHQLPD